MIIRRSSSKPRCTMRSMRGVKTRQKRINENNTAETKPEKEGVNCRKVDSVPNVGKENVCEGIQGTSVSFADAFWVWVKVALNSFGGPAGQIAVMHDIWWKKNDG